MNSDLSESLRGEPPISLENFTLSGAQVFSQPDVQSREVLRILMRLQTQRPEPRDLFANFQGKDVMRMAIVDDGVRVGFFQSFWIQYPGVVSVYDPHWRENGTFTFVRDECGEIKLLTDEPEHPRFYFPNHPYQTYWRYLRGEDRQYVREHSRPQK